MPCDQSWPESGPVVDEIPLFLGSSIREEVFGLFVEPWARIVPVLGCQQGEKVLLAL